VANDSTSDSNASSRGSQALPLTIEAELPRSPERSWPEYFAVTIVAFLLSAAAFVYYWHSGELLLYGDAVAHMNIARRVVDSRTPGLLQLGTVWLPLPHLLMLPFIWSTWMWQTGVGGAIPSMLAYVAGVVGIFRLVRTGLLFLPGYRNEARFAAWFAALVYAFNPNLLYLQTTAMTEPFYLALFIWATVFIAEFGIHLFRGDDQSARRGLLWCAAFLCLGIMTRYDGWFTAAAYSIAALVLLIMASLRSGLEPLHFLHERSWRRTALIFVVLLVVTPVAWFAYNAHEFKDPLAFARGPYSARGIEARSRKAGNPHHPGWNAPTVGATYFMKSAKLNVATTERSERIWFYAALLGAVMTVGFIRPLRAWLLLWMPVPFYAISMAWGGVPIFIPTWWPFSYYNVRYGTQLLPAFAVFGTVLLYLFLRRFSWRQSKVLLGAAAILFVSVSYYGLWRATPICLREARVNAADRIAIETKLAAELSQLPPDSTILMYMGEHGGALQRIGMPLNRTINECHKRYWGSALLNPALMADYVVATDGDPLSHAVREHPDGLSKVAEVTAPRQSSIAIYRSTLQK
jgi:hypothetical protein